MTRVQVVYASQHGGTAGIAERVAEILTEAGLDVSIANASTKPDPTGFDAYVIGSAVYLGRWLDDGIRHLERHAELLKTKPVWLFSSGPVSIMPKDQDPLEVALGPAEGPGSGGHKRVAALSDIIQPRDHRVFSGVYDPSDPPRGWKEKLIRLMPASSEALPAADFRDWVQVEKWAIAIARELLATPATTPVAAA